MKLALVLLVLVPSLANAQALYVRSAQVDKASNALVVRGLPFAAGIRVFLNFTELPVTSISANEVRATMPAVDFAPGTYSVILFQPGTAQLAFFSLSFERPPAVLQVGLNAPTTYEVSMERYIVEAPPAVVGHVIPLDPALVASLCKDKDGCDVTVQMINYDGAGKTASRSARLFVSETNTSWRFGDIDLEGVDGAGVQEWASWDCHFTDAETFGGAPNSRSDAGVGFGLLNVAGGSYSDVTTTCRVALID